MNMVHLSRENIKQISRLMEEFPDIRYFKLIEESNNGIGFTTDMIFNDVIKGYLVEVKISINSSEEW